jgi:hypothetical protein
LTFFQRKWSGFMKIRRNASLMTFASIATVLWVGLANPASAGSVTYVVTADTSYIAGVTGKLEFQFNPSGTPASATASVFNYQQTADTALALTSSTTGDASGVLPATLSFDNGTTSNDLQQGITFGASLSFYMKLMWAGPAPDGTSSTAFSFFLEDKDGAGLNLGPNNEAADLSIFGNGTTGYITYPNDDNDYNVRVHALEGTPEPSSMVLLGIGTIGLVVGVRARKSLRRKPA